MQLREIPFEEAVELMQEVAAAKVVDMGFFAATSGIHRERGRIVVGTTAAGRGFIVEASQ
jgi:rRNA processing protein Krr1/Pno1